MFKKDQLSIWDWLLFTLMMAVPIVNIICFFIILCSPEANRTLRSYLGFQIFAFVFSIVIVILFYASILDILGPYLDSLPF